MIDTAELMQYLLDRHPGHTCRIISLTPLENGKLVAVYEKIPDYFNYTLDWRLRNPKQTRVALFARRAAKWDNIA